MRLRTRILLVATVLLAGALFYFVRPTDPVAVSWADHAGLSSLARAAHDLRVFAWLHLPTPGWLRGSVSDLAYALALGIVFAGSTRSMLLVGLCAALGHELGQGLGWFAGTFDVLDLVILLVGYGLGAFVVPRGFAHRSPDVDRSSRLSPEPA